LSLETALESASAALVLLSVLLSWVSFRSGEAGATLDDWPESESGVRFDFDVQIVARGWKRRGRFEPVAAAGN
jgi:hypothetical protein